VNGRILQRVPSPANPQGLSSDAPYGNITIVSSVTQAGELVLGATVRYSRAGPNPADKTLSLKANTVSCGVVRERRLNLGRASRAYR